MNLYFPFQWAPTLGGECYPVWVAVTMYTFEGFNGHPPLGVNATRRHAMNGKVLEKLFQWAPTLGGECYTL